MTKKSPDRRDVEVGRRVRSFRLQRGMSQEKLAHQLGVTFQQVQKYEKGANRIGAGRLQRISEVLDVPIADLYATQKQGAAPAEEVIELFDTAASLRLVRAYARIRDPQVKHAVTHLLEIIAGR
ncbi:MAG TPA: helix-turn-helix transcriptional regulator [Xanthobacteraceae bacterium]|nr:helix-turn-helix transcriptional regulator [Xanthobacteraceae bacterium]